jgi:restriction system protein
MPPSLRRRRSRTGPTRPPTRAVTQCSRRGRRSHHERGSQCRAHSHRAPARPIPAREASLKATHTAFEEERPRQLKAEIARYGAECKEREKEVAEHNAAIDDLAAGLAYGAVDAAEEYVGIVLANSVYPEHFKVQHDAQFDPETAELKLSVIVPAPEELRTVKAYRYVKASDKIAETQLSKKEANDRYAGALHQVAIRSLH